MQMGSIFAKLIEICSGAGKQRATMVVPTLSGKQRE